MFENNEVDSIDSKMINLSKSNSDILTKQKKH